MRRLVVGLAVVSVLLVGLVVPAHAAATHTVNITCSAGTGFKVQGAVLAQAGDTLVVQQTGCVYFNTIQGRSAPFGSGFAPNPISGYNTTSGATITLTVQASLASGDTIVYFAPTTQGQTPPTDQIYVVYGTNSPPRPRLLHYVALGDSYSAGEGAYAYFADANGNPVPCHRAPTAWSFVLARGSTSIQDEVQNAACSGAKTPHLTSEWFQGEQPQAARLAELNKLAPVDLVTLTIGGNDIGFSGIARNCFVVDCRSELLNKTDKITTMRNAVQNDVIPALRAAAPSAKIVVVGYPRVVPTQQNETKGCGWLEPSERVLLNALLDDINVALRKAARNSGASFVDITEALKGHELCSKSSYFVNLGKIGGSEQGHPNAAGQVLLAAAVKQGLMSQGIIAN